jgi:hypothetical protein
VGRRALAAVGLGRPAVLLLASAVLLLLAGVAVVRADEDDELEDAVIPPDFDPELYQDILDAALWSGQYNPDDCHSDPCQNGGVCIDGIVAYHCACTHGWHGLECQDLADSCTLESQVDEVLHPGAVPVPPPGGWPGPIAPRGYARDEGVVLSELYLPHDCDPKHATCSATDPGDFTCACHGGYFSEDAARTCLDIDECASEPCEHGS